MRNITLLLIPRALLAGQLAVSGGLPFELSRALAMISFVTIGESWIWVERAQAIAQLRVLEGLRSNEASGRAARL